MANVSPPTGPPLTPGPIAPHRLDLGVSDVHQASPLPASRARKPMATPKPAPTEPKPAKGKPRKRRRLRVTLSHPVHGSLEVHLREGQEERTCRVMTTLAADAASDGPVWIQVARCGEFRGHGQGAFSLTPAIFDEIVRNFVEVDLGQVAFDFEHASEMDPAEGAIPTEGAPAQGWLRQLANRGAQGLWGLVEWLEPARTYIRQKKYRFLSPAIRFAARHPETGKPIGARLTSVALTNRPFLRGMVPLMATDSDGSPHALGGSAAYSTNETMPRLREALRLGALASPAQCAECVDQLCGLLDLAEGNHGAVVQGVPLGDYLPALRSLVNLPTHSTWDDVFAAVRALIAAAIAEHEAALHSDADDPPPSSRGPAAMTDTPPAAEASPMADPDLPTKLKDAETEVAKTTLALRDAQGQVTDLTSKLSAVEAEKATLATQLAESQAEVTRLTDEAKKRADADLQREVDEAHAIYRTKRNLTDADKAPMLVLARADLTAFRTMYPPVPPEQRHLLGQVATQGAAGAAPGSVASGVVPPAAPSPAGGNAGNGARTTVEIAGPVTLQSLTDALMREQKLSLADAQNQAARLLNLTPPKAATPRR